MSNYLTTVPWRLFYALVAIGFIYLILPQEVLYKTLSYDFYNVKLLISFNVFILTCIFCTFFMVGENNRRLIALYLGASIFETVLYFWMLTMDGFENIYLKMWVGFFTSLITYAVVRYQTIIFMFFYSLMTFSPMLRSYGMCSLRRLKPTRFGLQLVTVVRYFLIVEFLTAIYCFSYSIAMGVPSNGSLYKTIVLNGHVDYALLQSAGMDLILVYLIFVFVKSVLEEWKSHPDLLCHE